MAVRLLAVLALAGLSACGVVRETAPEIGLVAEAIRGGDAAPAATEPTRAGVAGFTDPLLYARIPERETNALLALAARNGRAQTWVSEDDVSLTLKNGVLVATRGLGADLISARVPELGSGETRVVRRHAYLDGNDQLRRIGLDCRLSDGGSEEVVVIERAYATRRIDEVCEGAGGRVVRNAYWVDGDGVVRQSRQWVGPRVGYITLQQVAA